MSQNVVFREISILGFRISSTSPERQATGDERVSTLVESALQIHLFIQNKPNFRKSQMNVKHYNTVDYVRWTLGERGKNKPNSNPIQSQSKPISANKIPIQTQFKPNSNPIYRGVVSGEAGKNPISKEV